MLTKLVHTNTWNTAFVFAGVSLFGPSFTDSGSVLPMVSTLLFFLLGFFNSLVYSRWWKFRELCGVVNGRTVDTAVMVAAYVGKGTASALDPSPWDRQRKDLIRLLGLSHALHAQSARQVDLDVKALVNANLLDEYSHQYDTLVQVGFPDFNLSYSWFVFALRTYVDKGAIPAAYAPQVVQNIQTNITACRGAAADVLMYLNTPIPTYYMILLEATLYAYFACMAMWFADASSWYAPCLVFGMVVLVLGVFQQAKDMLNPFQTQHSAEFGYFDVGAFASSTYLSCKRVERNCGSGRGPAPGRMR